MAHLAAGPETAKRQRRKLSAGGLPPPVQVIRNRRLSRLGLASFVALLALSYQGAEISPIALVEGLGDAWRYIVGTPDRPGSGYFPPSTSRLGEYAEQMLVTIQMAVWGTTLSIPASLLLAFLGARNVHGNVLVYHVARRILDFLRSLNDLVIALVFVAAVGLGPFTGVLALAVGGVGSFGKLLSEAIEAVDLDQVEAVRATGAHPIQVITHGFWPQIAPHFISIGLFRFESDVRSATVLGIVGAGGIGYHLIEAMRSFDNRNAAMILIIIVVSVMVIDWISSFIRRRVI